MLVHGDYRLDNAVLAPDGEVRAVLDWELCTVGDPLADVGLMIAYWNELGAAAGPAALFREPVTAVPGFPSAQEIGRLYAELSGRRSSTSASGSRLPTGRSPSSSRASTAAGSTTRRTDDAGTLQPAVPRLGALPATRSTDGGQPADAAARRVGDTAGARLQFPSTEGSKRRGAREPGPGRPTSAVTAGGEEGANPPGSGRLLRPSRLRADEVGRRRGGGPYRLDGALPLLRVEAALPLRDHGRSSTCRSGSSGSSSRRPTGPTASSRRSSRAST